MCISFERCWKLCVPSKNLYWLLTITGLGHSIRITFIFCTAVLSGFVGLWPFNYLVHYVDCLKWVEMLAAWSNWIVTYTVFISDVACLIMAGCWPYWMLFCLQCVAFHDVSPQAPTHFLVIPRKPVPGLSHTTDEDEQVKYQLLVTFNSFCSYVDK